MGLRLSGTLTDGSQPATWLYRTRRWLHECWGTTLVASELSRSERSQTRLTFRLHPGAPDVQIAADEHGGIRVVADTGCVGPGYHAHVCELLRTMGNVLSVDWVLPELEQEAADDSGYFFTEARDALEIAMLRSLAAAVRLGLEQWKHRGEQFALSLPETYTFTFEGVAATPLGPRNEQWLRTVAQDPARGRDVFAWWEPGQGASYRLGRALAEMWTSVRWRRPITDAETAQLARVLQLLRGAHGLDPELSLPYGEWEELQGYLGDPTPIPQREDTHTPSPIGYRRRDVQVKLAGGWSVRVPGSFAETWEEDGTYCGWDGKKTVWFTPLHVSERDPPEPAAELLPELDTGERPVQLRGLPAGLLERTGVGELLGERGAVRRLGSRMALPGRLVLFTVTYDDPADFDWAMQTLESVRHPDAAG